MGYKITIKKETKCKECKGLGYYTFEHDKSRNITVEYFCNKCDGKGKAWETIDMPLSSLKRLLK
jgi:DnaJ-class molecular chaperone